MTPYKGVRWTWVGQARHGPENLLGWQRNRLLDWSHSFQEKRKCSGHHIGLCFLMRHFPPHLGILLLPLPKLLTARGFQSPAPQPSVQKTFPVEYACEGTSLRSPAERPGKLTFPHSRLSWSPAACPPHYDTGWPHGWWRGCHKQTRNSSMSQERTVFQSGLRVGLSGFPSGVWFSCLASDWDRRAVRQKVDREWASLRHIIFTEALPGAGRDSKLELIGRVPMKAVPLGREWWEKKVPEKEWTQRHPSSCCPMVLQGALWSLCGSAGPNPLF